MVIEVTENAEDTNITKVGKAAKAVKPTAFKPRSSRLLNLEQIRKGLKDRRLYRVALYTELSYPTIQKLVNGKDSNPTYRTIASLSDYLINGVNGAVKVINNDGVVEPMNIDLIDRLKD